MQKGDRFFFYIHLHSITLEDDVKAFNLCLDSLQNHHVIILKHTIERTLDISGNESVKITDAMPFAGQLFQLKGFTVKIQKSPSVIRMQTLDQVPILFYHGHF